MAAPSDVGNALPLTPGWQLAFVVAQRTMDDLPELTTAAFIGIMIAISGNVLISLALNLQKLAHKRVEAATRARREGGQDGKSGGNGGVSASNSALHRHSDRPSLDENDEDCMAPPTPPSLPQQGRSETEPLIPFPQAASPASDYGTLLITPKASNPPLEESHPRPSTPIQRSTFTSRLIPSWFRRKERVTPTPLQCPTIPVDVVSEQTLLRHQNSEPQTSNQKDYLLEDGNEAEYLKSKLWWLGFLLMNLGETGNFISYAWAPASVVAPLGTFALMANCVFAPVMLGERFRKRDLLGILIAIVGAVTVVLASNASDVRLDPDTLLVAISQTPFIIYSCVYLGGAIILATLSHSEIGRQWVFIDVGLCALFGGFTVLSTKAISTLLTMEWITMFSKWITYPILAVLAITGVGQIRYLNRALMRFDSKVVIPVQFVLFTLSAIIGSAILYGDFKKAKFHQIVTFLYGCAATFLGVFIIAWAPTPEHQEDEEGGDSAGTSITHSRATNDEPRRGLGSIGRRRATLILPGGAKDTPILRNQHSNVSLIALSPAQHLLLVHTPPREFPIHSHPQRLEDRRRTMSWVEDGTREAVSPGGTREGSLSGRLRHLGTRVGSLDHATDR